MNNEDKSNLLNLLIEIPKIGPIISLVILIGPPAILIAIIGESVGNAIVLILSIATLLWLKFLENRAGIRMLLPIPIINIPWLWVTWVGIVMGVLSLFSGG